MGKRGPKPRVKKEESNVSSEATQETLATPVASVSETHEMTGGVDGMTETPTPPSTPVNIPEPPTVNTSGYPDDVWETRKVLKLPLDPNQEFFESPEGYIVIGEKGRGRVWCRQSNGRKGSWINPMR